MKYAVIDIGSNSVRLMMSDGVKTLYKKVKTTRLSEGLVNGASLNSEAVERTAMAVCFFVNEARSQNADFIYAFATAAARRADNSYLLTERVEELCGIKLEIISGEKEAEIGVLGALNGKDGAVLDIGGASSEIIVIKGGKKEYCYSLDLGVVKLTEKVGQDKALATAYVKEQIEKYGKVPFSDFFAIGGTATSIAAIMQELSLYDPNKVHGFEIKKEQLKLLCDRLYQMTVEQRKNLKGLQKERAEVIASGAVLLYEIMSKIGLGYVTVSENDNLEGYLINKRGQNEQKD